MAWITRRSRSDKRGTWWDVFRSLLIVLFLYLGLRWALWEPFVIPSGSMEQTLLVQDYVLVKKFAYGLRVPFSKTWILGPHLPKRGDVIVFKEKSGGGNFIVKRVVGLPGDRVQMDEQGFIQVNGLPFRYQQVGSEDQDKRVYRENNGDRVYRVQYAKNRPQSPFEVEVPTGQLFMMGDNRNYSHDSRFWGGLPMENIMGQLVLIWMSCEDSDDYSSFLCSPKDFRQERILMKVDSGA